MIYWISSTFATAVVEIDERAVIVKSAPIWRKFVGQPLANLVRWLRKKKSSFRHPARRPKPTTVSALAAQQTLGDEAPIESD